MYLSIRLALCDLLLGDCPPLIWDDALVLLDDYRCKNVLEVLAEQAEKQQILLFSCHRREWNFVQAMENGALIELEE